jgi:hypothetical protein
MSDHPSDHIAVWEAETFESPSERAWLRWIDEVEKLAGHDLDGDQAEDGYSMDGFHELFEKGRTPEQAVAEIGSLTFT